MIHKLIVALSDLDAASKGWDLLFQYHGRPSGIYAADEYLAGLEAVRGYVPFFESRCDPKLIMAKSTELCLVVVRLTYLRDGLGGTRSDKPMFVRKLCFRTSSFPPVVSEKETHQWPSGSYLYQVIGDPKFADRVGYVSAVTCGLTGLNAHQQVERITYNALPATLTGGSLHDTPSVLHTLSSGTYGRHVVPAVPPAAEPNRVQEYVAVRDAMLSRSMVCAYIEIVTHSRTMGKLRILRAEAVFLR